MFLTSRPSNLSILKATLVLSLLLHGLGVLAFSLVPEEEPQKLRVVARVDVVDKLRLPAQPAVRMLPRPKPPPPLPDRLVRQAGWVGTRPGEGGDPAPAPKALRMNLPRSQRSQTNPDSNVLRGQSVEGDPDRGNAFGDPNGVHGGTGEGGNGPGGTGGSGQGGYAAANATPEDIMRAGLVECNGCHVEPGKDGQPPIRPRPLSLEMMAQSTGWRINQFASREGGVEAEFEYELDADGRVLKLRILKTSNDPVLREALSYFASLAEWTAPGKHCYAVAPIRFHPPQMGR